MCALIVIILKKKNPILQQRDWLAQLFAYVLIFFLGMWNLGSLIRDQTHNPCVGRRSFNPWTARKALNF